MATDTALTVAAICTPQAAGGIAVIRISGGNAVGVAAKVFRPVSQKLEDMGGYRAAYGHFFDANGDFDEGIAVIYRAPHSYTGEDVAELCCHGGIFVARKLLAAVLAAGASAAGPGEFTRRAYENGKLDLTAAESVMALINARGEAALREAYEAGRGRLWGEANGLKQICVGAAAAVAAYLEYPDGDIEPPCDTQDKLREVVRRCRALIRNFDNGRIFREGLKTVIVGRPNVGKSALMNLLAGCERSIVTSEEGTTRDVVEECVRLGDVILRLEDTAGIREGAGEAESIGIRRALDEAAGAQLILAVFDGAQPLDSRDEQVIELCKGVATVCVINKSDLPQVIDVDRLRACFSTVTVISALDSDSAAVLETAIRQAAGAAEPDCAAAFNERQRACLCRAAELAEGIAADIGNGITDDAVQIGIERVIECFCELTGENASQSVIDRVFSDFCVGK